MPQDSLGLFDTPVDRRHSGWSLAILGALAGVFVLVLPVRDVRLGEVGAFIPTVDAVMFIGDMITATLLYAQASVFRSRALTVLATTCVYTAALFVSHALTFPGAFASDGLLGAGVNTTAWLGMFRRAPFPIAVVLYIMLRRADAEAQPEIAPPTRVVGWVLAGIALATAATILATIGHGLLPPFFQDRSHVIYAYAITYEAGVLALLLVASALLFRARRSVLDTWLLVSLSGFVIQSLLIMLLKGRFTVGWYALYGVTLVSHLVVTLALIAESNRLYARLALATAARNRERASQLVSMSAMAAAIAHEVGQPLSAVNNHAASTLRWLTRPQPDLDRAVTSAGAVLEAGRRTSEVVNSVRRTFGKRPSLPTEFCLNDLARETASLLDRELAGHRISLQFALDEPLPPLLADRVQIQRVLMNLLINAIESVGSARGRPRQITIGSTALDCEEVLLEVSDNGIGIAPDTATRIFEPFVTTKANGTGLGLSLSRTIVESHGGHLWATPREAFGATFHLRLPAAAQSDAAERRRDPVAGGPIG